MINKLYLVVSVKNEMHSKHFIIKFNLTHGVNPLMSTQEADTTCIYSAYIL